MQIGIFSFGLCFFLPKFKVSAREMTYERNKKTYMEKYPMAKVLIYFFLRLTTQLLSSFWNLLLQRKYTNGALFFVLSVLLQDFYCSQMGKAIQSPLEGKLWEGLKQWEGHKSAEFVFLGISEQSHNEFSNHKALCFAY